MVVNYSGFRCLKGAKALKFVVREEKGRWGLYDADAVDADLALGAVHGGSAIDLDAVLGDADVVHHTVGVSVAVDLNALLVLALGWETLVAIGSDEALGSVVTFVAVAVGSG